MESTILRKHVVKAIFSGEPFDAEFVTADIRRKTGGDLIRVEGWRILAPEENAPDAKELAPDANKTARGAIKDPAHAENGTINIYNPANRKQHITSVHVDLIQFFNGKRVTNG